MMFTYPVCISCILGENSGDDLGLYRAPKRVITRMVRKKKITKISSWSSLNVALHQENIPI